MQVVKVCKELHEIIKHIKDGFVRLMRGQTIWPIHYLLLTSKTWAKKGQAFVTKNIEAFENFANPFSKENERLINV